MNRQESNREILKMLSTLVEALPDQRFNQLLYNLDAISNGDEYATESSEILDRMKLSRIWRVLNNEN